MADLNETRRRFMTHFASIGLGTTLVPGVVWARMQDAGEKKITVAMVADAMKISGLEFTDDELKGMVDSANQTLTVYRLHSDEPGDVALSIPYLLLLGRASREVRAAGGPSVQFRILHVSYTASGPTSVVMFRSAIHAVRPLTAARSTRAGVAS